MIDEEVSIHLINELETFLGFDLCPMKSFWCDENHTFSCFFAACVFTQPSVLKVKFVILLTRFLSSKCLDQIS